MDLEPAPNNGTMGSLHHMLRNPKPLPDDSTTPTPKMDCPFPSTDEDYNMRLENDTSGCHCVSVLINGITNSNENYTNALSYAHFLRNPNLNGFYVHLFIPV